jgi:hypothetical protein
VRKNILQLQLALGLTSIVLSGLACSTPQTYVPAERRATSTKGNEAIYNEPPGNPTGTVRIQYEGIDDYEVQKGKKVRALHLHMVASNHATQGTWNIHPNDSFVSFPNGTRAQPVAANPPTLELQPGELRPMELYFPLPAGLKSEDDIREFDFHWQAKAVDQTVTETTPFDRVPVQQYIAYDPYWDAGAFYPSYPYYPGTRAGLGFGFGYP